MHCLHKLGEVCTQFQEKIAIHFILLHLVHPTSVTVQQSKYTIWWKSICTLTSVAKDAWYCLYRLQSLTGYARNSRKNNYALRHLVWTPNPMSKLALKRMLDTAFIGFGVRRGLYKVLGKKQPYTYIRLVKCALMILYTILGKPSYTLT